MTSILSGSASSRISQELLALITKNSISRQKFSFSVGQSYQNITDFANSLMGNGEPAKLQ